MRLRPYISQLDFDIVKNWINDERTHAMWCAGRFPYPLEKESFEASLAEHAVNWGDCPFVACEDDGSVVGFFCYSVNLDTNEGMLKFVAVDNTLRGKGYGRKMIELALKYAFEITKASKVQLFVFFENTSAVMCYTKSGFSERSITEKAFRYKDESWSRCNMAISKDEYEISAQ